MLSLYGKSIMDVQDEAISDNARKFQFWLMIEIIVILCTVLTTVIYLFTRTLSKETLRLDWNKLKKKTEEVEEDTEFLNESDKTQDFMSSKHVELYLPIVRTALWPLIATSAIHWVKTSMKEREVTLNYEPTSKASMEYLETQGYMQLVQTMFFAAMHLINWRNGKFVGKRTKTCW
jgi:hypothetical protein